MKKQFNIRTFGLVLLILFNFTYIVFGDTSDFNMDSPSIIKIGVNPSVLPDEMFYTIFETANAQSNIERNDGLIGLKHNQQVMIATVKNGVFLIDKQAFDKIPEKNRVRAFHFFIDGLEKMEDDQNKNEIIDFMADLQNSDDTMAKVVFLSIYSEIKGDLYSAYTITNPFMYIVNTILGVGAVVLIGALLFSTVLDLCYLGFSYFTEGPLSSLVSHEAIQVEYAFQKGFDEGYRNKYFEYLKCRALSYIILAICITYLICGGISGIIAFILNLVNGVVGA